MNAVALTVNAKLKVLQQQLVDFHQVLANQLDKAKTQADGDAILREMQDVNFRVTMCGNLLFKQATDEINAQISAVSDATTTLNKSIAKAANISDLITQVSTFLGGVDKVLVAVKLA